ncbi:MAG: hypothetical protein NT131_07995 [Methanomassiliicoccales archaeon]|nr:hypothetical protein [Methanomassiliicoccales archaeon]
MVRPVVKCYNCDWEGKDEELVDKPGNLLFYDYVLINNLKDAKVTRSNLLCPKCGTVIKSRRLIDGVIFDR